MRARAPKAGTDYELFFEGWTAECEICGDIVVNARTKYRIELAIREHYRLAHPEFGGVVGGWSEGGHIWVN